MKHKHEFNPTFSIDISTLKKPYDICDFFEVNKIDDYVYKIFYKKHFLIKTGVSAETSGQPGDRAYRQIGHLVGWKNRLVGPNGDEMEDIARDFEKLTGIVLNRNDITLEIINMTNVTGNVKDECLDLERHFINSYVDFFGEPPIGNKDQTTKIYETVSKNEKNLWNWFEVV
jgi:hypothetical protein